jgi:hypothetical protein
VLEGQARRAHLVHQARQHAAQAAHLSGNTEARGAALTALAQAGDEADRAAGAYTAGRHAAGGTRRPDEALDAGTHAHLRDTRAAHEEARLLAGHLARMHEHERAGVWQQAKDEATTRAGRTRPSEQSAAYHRAHAVVRGDFREHLRGTRDHATRWHDAATEAHGDLQDALSQQAAQLFTAHLAPTTAPLVPTLDARVAAASADYLRHAQGTAHALGLAAHLLASRTPFFDTDEEATSFLALVTGTYLASPSGLPRGLALQQAAAREFSLPLPRVPSGAEAVTGALVRRLGPRLQVALRALYAVTQADLASWNLPGLVVYRGLPQTPPDLRSALLAGYADTATAPLSSWTTERALAERRAGTRGVLLAALAPRERVLSCATLGLGDPTTAEVVVLGGEGTVRLFSAQLPDDEAPSSPMTSEGQEDA